MLDKRAKRKQQTNGENSATVVAKRAPPEEVESRERKRPARVLTADESKQLAGVLGRIF